MIAIDLRSLMGGGKVSGVENYLLHILERLPNSDGKYFGFYNSHRGVKLPEQASQLLVKRTKIPNKILNAALTFLNLPKFEKLYGDFDVLWMPDVRPFALAGKTKLAVTVHDLSPLTHPEYYSLKRRIWHKVVRYGKIFRRADLIFADSEYTKLDLIRLFGLPEDKVKTVYLGVDHGRFHTGLDQRLVHKVKERYQLPDKFILSISTVEPRKNISSLISAFERIEDPDAYLVIAGKLGWLFRDILKQINQSPKSAKIRLVGYVREEDKPFLISQSEIVCYPSYYEGFGFVPLEAMACGVPVIASTRTSMPEVCKDAALAVEPDSLPDLVNALDALLSDQNLRRCLIEKGLLRAKIFDWSETVKTIDNYLRSL